MMQHILDHEVRRVGPEWSFLSHQLRSDLLIEAVGRYQERSARAEQIRDRAAARAKRPPKAIRREVQARTDARFSCSKAESASTLRSAPQRIDDRIGPDDDWVESTDEGTPIEFGEREFLRRLGYH